MENIDLFSIKRCWGNLAFDYAHSASVGNSGGILCVWDPKSFSKLNATISDYFVMSYDSMSKYFAITLNASLSDHVPILMLESITNTGPVPFRFFHYWFEIKGFDKFVEDSWKEAVVVEPNAMTKLMKKLKHLKEKIRLWNKGIRLSN
ncbi:hypothetical protein Tco_0705496 [Tanacetum coccineum]|uniref:RNA-directed DNA polymerase, eukaryota n=1 Tax=Tanacetum coccineum TaxID=301880 RepID=A0ABQ4Y6P6_9ASTR